MSFPYCPVSAQVTSTDPDNHAVYVQFLQQGNERPTLPARVLIHGMMDGVRINQKPLPGVGTVGLVVAVNGDPRSLVWLGAIAANGQDAITSGPGNDFIEYESHYSGLYKYLDESGNTATEYPDGTLITVGASGAPALHRHTIGSNGLRSRVPFTQGQRVPNPPATFPVNIDHASGTKLQVDAAGNVTVSGVANIIISTSAGLVDIGNFANALFRLVDERMVTLFNEHTHGGVSPGGSSTSGPSPTMAVGSQTTTVTFAN